jgi:hypothetical protein
MSHRIFTVRGMTLVRWLMTLGADRATSNAAAVLEARHRAEAQVDAVARRLGEQIPAAA